MRLLAERVAAAKFPGVTASRAAAPGLLPQAPRSVHGAGAGQDRRHRREVQDRRRGCRRRRISGGRAVRGHGSAVHRSTPELKETSGRLGWVARRLAPAPLARRRWRTAGRTLSRPVQAGSGWHVLKVYRPPGADDLRFDRTRGAIARELTGQARAAALAEWLAVVRARAQVVSLAVAQCRPAPARAILRADHPSGAAVANPHPRTRHRGIGRSGHRVAGTAARSTWATSPGPGTRRRCSGSRLSWPGWCSSAASRPPSWAGSAGRADRKVLQEELQRTYVRLRQAEAALPASSPVLAASGGSAGEGGGPVSGERLETPGPPDRAAAAPSVAARTSRADPVGPQATSDEQVAERPHDPSPGGGGDS